jgi:GNAT superfamily N-acetyltransferase
MGPEDQGEGRPSEEIGVRTATPGDAAVLAALLDQFNREFGDPSPGPDVLTRRLTRLLAADSTVGLLAGSEPVGFALLTLRPNVWYDAPVALLDELYVVPARRSRGIGSALLLAGCELVKRHGVQLMEINVDGEDVDARRFYERHGFSCVHGDHAEPELYYSREPL